MWRRIFRDSTLFDNVLMAINWKNQSGWTLIELITVIGLLGLLASATVYVGNNIDAAKYEETKSKMKIIRTAILGDESVDASGHRNHFGYVGDMGRLPAALTDLVTRGTQPTWAYDTTQGFGSGWRGPYVNSQLIDAPSVANDAWGTAFVYNTSNTATITTRGSDLVSGGTGYATDATVQIPQTQIFADVRGILADRDQRFSGKTVTVHYPADGTKTTANATSSARGSVNFSGIPYGIRSIEVTSSPAIPPTRLVVDRPSVDFPFTLLDYQGQAAVTLSGAASVGGTGNSEVTFTIASTYGVTLTASRMTISWSQIAFLKQIICDPSGTPLTENLSNVPSGTRNTISSSFTVAGGGTKAFKLVFAGNKDGFGTTDMSDTKFIVQFDWTGNYRYDTLSFTTP
jgi:prepilin-type N-terminal cleavage/methylation domain-containing protein